MWKKKGSGENMQAVHVVHTEIEKEKKIKCSKQLLWRSEQWAEGQETSTG